MTPFQKNITKSIDNLQVLERDLNLVYGENLPKNIDKMLEDNIDSKSGNNLTFNNTVKNGKFDIVPLGNCEQDTNIITYTCTGLETGVYDFIYNEVTYYFTMPTVTEGDVIYFNIDTLKLYKGETEIETSSTGEESTTITFVSTPNPDYPQDIRVVTGDNSVIVQNKNLVISTIVGSNINASGHINNSDNNSMVIARVVQGQTYTITTDKDSFFYGYFTTPPELYSTSYNNSRSSSSNKTITASITGYIAFQTSKTYETPQIEKGETATTYIAPQIQTKTLHLGTEYLAGIGDYKDGIEGKTDDWKIVRNVKKVIFNGTESWVKNIAIDNWFYVDNFFNGCALDKNKNDFALCNRYIQNNYATVSTIENGKFAIGIVGEGANQRNRCAFKNTSVSTAQAFATLVASKNITIYCALATPTEETITDQTLITDLNKLYKDAITYEGQTNIVVESDSSNAQMILDVNAFVTEKEE